MTKQEAMRRRLLVKTFDGEKVMWITKEAFDLEEEAREFWKKEFEKRLFGIQIDEDDNSDQQISDTYH